MDNNAHMKRKAQELARKGNLQAASEQYRLLAEREALEPYDLVVFGDLLSRNGNRQDAVQRYLEAMAGYSTAGLNRNAIALAKKVQRLAPNLVIVHRRLGDFYASEGLSSESCLHYLEYLQRVDRADSQSVTEVEDVCVRLLDLSLPSFDVVDTIVQLASVTGCQAKLVPGVLHQAKRAASMGNAEAELRLLDCARKLDPDAVIPEAGSGTTAAPEATFFDPGAVDLTPEVESDAISLDDEDVGVSKAAPSASTGQDLLGGGQGISLDIDYEEIEAPGSDATPAGMSPPAPDAPPPHLDAAAGSGGDEDEEAEADGDVLRARGLEFQMSDEPALAQRAFLKAAAAYFHQGRAQEAGDLYERVVRIDPNQLDALKGLVELAHINGEKAKMAHWGCELGDVLLARERYANAKVQFERVLAFDPENPKARSRLRRLNAIAGVSEATFGELTPAAGEVQGAQVTVRDEETQGSQSAFDLSQILDEFRAAVVDRIPPEDGQSHYDLGMTYKEMGLLQEAALEFEAAASHEENRSSSLEMLGECYLELDQSEDAVRILEQVLPLADDETRAMTHLRLGKAREALGEWDRAEEDYYRALELKSDLTEANELLVRLEHRREQGAA